MSDIAKDVAATRRTNWDVKWNSIGLGLLDDVDPNFKLMLDDIKTGTTGKVVLGRRMTGVDASMKISLRQITLTAIQTVQPWQPAVHPPLGTDLYTYAQLLNLHPVDKGDDLTEDMNFFKATPVSTYNIKRAGDKDDVLVVEFAVFPDRTRLLSGESCTYGYIGSTAPTDA